jgi:hypothetical protein
MGTSTGAGALVVIIIVLSPIFMVPTKKPLAGLGFLRSVYELLEFFGLADNIRG